MLEFFKLVKSLHGEDVGHFLTLKMIKEKMPKLSQLMNTSESIERCIEALKFYSEADVYMAYVGQKGANDDFGNNIEMVMSVTTAPNVNFSSHMGLTRIPDYEGTKHKDISMGLHAFAAKFITSSANPREESKKFMINYPNDYFKKLMLQNLGEKNIRVDTKFDAKQIKVSFWKKNSILKHASDDVLKVALPDLPEISGFEKSKLIECIEFAKGTYDCLIGSLPQPDVE